MTCARILVSVVVPLYNKAKFIERCLASIAAQTATPLEVIVVDDGSTDGGCAIASNFAPANWRIVTQENCGVSVARNKGAEIAEGDWVAFLDADDEYLPVFLESVASAIHSHREAEVVYGWTQDTAIPRGGKKDEGPPRVLASYLEEVVSGRSREMSSSCVVIRKDLFLKSGGFPVGVARGEDSDLWLRLGISACIVEIPRVLALYHSSASDSNWQQQAVTGTHWVKTADRLISSESLPKHIRSSLKLYKNHYQLSRVIYLSRSSMRLKALVLLLSEVDMFASPKTTFLKALIFFALPSALVAWLIGLKQKHFMRTPACVK